MSKEVAIANIALILGSYVLLKIIGVI